MLVTPKLAADGRQIETVTLSAVAPGDYEFLTGLYREYLEAGALEIHLTSGERLRSAVSERRRSPRIRARIRVQLLWSDDQKDHKEHTFTTSVSWFGCAVRSHAFLRPGTRVELRRGDQAAEARVVHSLWDRSTNLIEVGLAFDSDRREFWGISAWE